MSTSKSKTQMQPKSDIDEIILQYILKRPLYEEYTIKLSALLESLLKSQKIETHLIEKRTKEVESFKEKISRASKKYQNPLIEITDFSGIRIIVYYEEDLDKVCRLIENEFEIDKENSKVKTLEENPEVFGYQSTHYIIKLSKSRSALLEWRSFSELKAEIQVRTVLQHAWAAISHKLQYKREADIPNVLKRKLFRLSALLEMADEEFLDIRDRTMELTQDIEKRLSVGDKDISIDSVTLPEYISKSQEVIRLFKESLSVGFQYDEDIEAEQGDTQRDISGFILLCNHVNIKTIAKLEEVLKSSRAWSIPYLSAQVKASPHNWSINSMFICELVIIKVFRKIIDIDFLVNQQDWSKDVATRVLLVASD